MGACGVGTLAVRMLRKYLLRKDFFSRVNHKRWRIQRKLTKDAFVDQSRLLEGETVTTIFDVGANVGDITARYLELFPRSTVFCFEPFPEALVSLERRFRNCNRVKLEPYALSSSRGISELFVSQTPVMNSLLEPVDLDRWGFDKNNPSISIATITMDDFCAENNIEQIDVLKMDVQGSEFNVLIGASNLLKQSSIKVIYTEWQIVPFYEEQRLQADLSLLLAKYGYTLFNIYNLIESKLGQARWGDAIYLSPVVRGRLENKLGRIYCGW